MKPFGHGPISDDGCVMGFTEREVETIILGLAEARYPETFSADELPSILEKLFIMRMGGSLVDMVLKGAVAVKGIDDGELLFTKLEKKHAK